MDTINQKTVGEVVAEDYRAAAVFEKYGIDFCCKGGTALSVACEKKNISVDQLYADLDKLPQEADAKPDYKTWSPVELIEHIESKHHTYVEEKIPVILQFLQKLCKVHGERHPELHDIHDLFQQSAADLVQHMKKEELILFPRIRQMASVSAAEAPLASGMLNSPIEVMMHEHDTEGERFRTMAKLTNQYEPPADGCTTYRVAFSMLREFEQDLHLHIHLENNILFPKAIELEKSLSNPVHSN